MKLGDFGLSKRLAEDSIFAKTNVGTPYYMSPEQVSSSEYNEKSDIWALGCILYEMAALKVPFQATNYLKLAEIINKAEKPDIPDGYTKNLKKIINLMTERDPNDRPTASWLLNIPAIKLIVDQAEVSRKARENKEKEEMLNKWEEELKSKEKRLKEKYEEFKYERSKYELKIKQIESINVEFERKGSKNPTRNFMPEYNTQINKSYKGIMDQLKLNHTIDDHIDTSAMYNSKDQHIRGSLKYNNMLYNKKQFLR